MKKLLVLFLTVLFVLSFAGCKDKNGKDAPKVKTEGETAVESGNIPDLSFQLGSDPDNIEDFYEDYISKNEGTDEYIVEQEGELTVLLETNSVKYYYEKEKEDNGIGFIAVLSDCLGYERGVMMPEDIQNEFVATGTLSDATEEEMFFLPAYEENCKVLKYDFGRYKLEFYFVNDFLSATVIYDSENWTV